MEKIIVIIEADGEVKTHVEGVEGQACEAHLAPLDGFGEVREEGHTDDWEKTQRRVVSVRREVRAR